MKKLFLLSFLLSIIFLGHAWAQSDNSESIESLEDDLMEEPIDFFQAEGRGVELMLFIAGIGVYSIFVWYFYRIISKRDLIPRFYLDDDGNIQSRTKLGAYTAIYVVLFPIIIFIWFTVLGFFIFIVGRDFPMNIALFISLAVIGVVRILSYYREDAAKEVGKMIPYALLAFFLTSSAIYLDPNFLKEGELRAAVDVYLEHFNTIVSSITIVLIFEAIFRVAFIFKRKFWPVADQKLEETIEQQIDRKLNAHYKKIEDKEKSLQTKLDEHMEKFKQLQENQNKLIKDLEKRQKEPKKEL